MNFLKDDEANLYEFISAYLALFDFIYKDYKDMVIKDKIRKEIVILIRKGKISSSCSAG